MLCSKCSFLLHLVLTSETLKELYMSSWGLNVPVVFDQCPYCCNCSVLDTALCYLRFIRLTCANMALIDEAYVAQYGGHRQRSAASKLPRQTQRTTPKKAGSKASSREAATATATTGAAAITTGQIGNAAGEEHRNIQAGNVDNRIGRKRKQPSPPPSTEVSRGPALNEPVLEDSSFRCSGVTSHQLEQKHFKTSKYL